ncbi:plasmid mobilization relaxosome protein MobC [Paenibacillus hemerocallicola]|uniref:Plasmid mobilization relaxosome protein MobC n=1 Tax=Paenibacillus hemerocallicola TaxID=1172614 RepID=A0A5C4T887_9BACL|nr:plasmid mobilization relaxosome protein MobC [Paenibacillus hemerocallicola]TNJ65304.1 plasmid mobilization relaxosome protein MobC [Paenibacillus hemerocallicola]
MRKRSLRIQVWVNQEEDRKLQKHAKQSGLSREAYLRALINGYVPKTLPSIDYYTMLRELHAIGNNLNQLAAKAHATGHLDRTSFQRESDDLRRAVQQIQEAVTAPEPRQSSS